MFWSSGQSRYLGGWQADTQAHFYTRTPSPTFAYTHKHKHTLIHMLTFIHSHIHQYTHTHPPTHTHTCRRPTTQKHIHTHHFLVFLTLYPLHYLNSLSPTAFLSIRTDHQTFLSFMPTTQRQFQLFFSHFYIPQFHIFLISTSPFSRITNSFLHYQVLSMRASSEHS